MSAVRRAHVCMGRSAAVGLPPTPAKPSDNQRCWGTAPNPVPQCGLQGPGTLSHPSVSQLPALRVLPVPILIPGVCHRWVTSDRFLFYQSSREHRATAGLVLFGPGSRLSLQELSAESRPDIVGRKFNLLSGNCSKQCADSYHLVEQTTLRV